MKIIEKNNSEWIVSFNFCGNYLEEKIGNINEISEDEAYRIGKEIKIAYISNQLTNNIENNNNLNYKEWINVEDVKKYIHIQKMK